MDDDEDDQEGDDLGENEDKFSEDDLLAMSRGEDLFNG